MKKGEKPQIELYLYSLNQEFPVKKGHNSFLKRHSEVLEDPAEGLVGVEQLSSQTFKDKAGDWSVQWLHNKWIKNYTKKAGLGYQDVSVPLEQLMMRREDFGGIVFDPASDRVYKVNDAGYDLLDRLVTTAQGGKLSSLRAKLEKESDAKEFVGFLKGAGLWL